MLNQCNTKLKKKRKNAWHYGIYFTDSASKPVSVNFYDLATGNTRKLMTLKQTPIPGNGPGISISPDGRWLLYGQSGDESSEIMLVSER